MNGWNLFDFAVAGGLLAGAVLIHLSVTRMVRKPRQRVLLGIVLAVALFLVWAELAVASLARNSPVLSSQP